MSLAQPFKAGNVSNRIDGVASATLEIPYNSGVADATRVEALESNPALKHRAKVTPALRAEEYFYI
jgi:hypothetical protein